MFLTGSDLAQDHCATSHDSWNLRLDLSPLPQLNSDRKVAAWIGVTREPFLGSSWLDLTVQGVPVRFDSEQMVGLHDLVQNKQQPPNLAFNSNP